jgi:uncharacterized GH25 family protein
MPRSVISSVVILTFALVSPDEECWLGPDKFHYAIGEEMKIDFLTGENFVDGFWDEKKNKAEVVKWLSVSGVKDLSKEAILRDNHLKLKALQEGTQMVVMETNTLSRNWEAGKLKSYLEDNGLHDPGKNTTILDEPAREEYTRYAKLLVQVGERTDDMYKKKAGLRLEIIPEKNPYTLRTGDHLQCRVLYEGKPIPHTLVKVWSRLNRTTFLQNMYTEDDGTVRFPVSTKGGWMVSTVKMIPVEKPGADWHSVWGSLVFGIE